MALQLVNVVLESGRSLEDLAALFHRYPLVLLNVRVLVRASSTESLVRVMTESVDARVAQDVARDLADLISRRLGGTVISPPAAAA